MSKNLTDAGNLNKEEYGQNRKEGIICLQRVKLVWYRKYLLIQGGWGFSQQRSRNSQVLTWDKILRKVYSLNILLSQNQRTSTLPLILLSNFASLTALHSLKFLYFYFPILFVQYYPYSGASRDGLQWTNCQRRGPGRCCATGVEEREKFR